MTFARIRAIAIVSVLVVAALVFVAAAILRDNQTGGVASGCPKDAVLADTRLPDETSSPRRRPGRREAGRPRPENTGSSRWGPGVA